MIDSKTGEVFPRPGRTQDAGVVQCDAGRDSGVGDIEVIRITKAKTRMEHTLAVGFP